MLTLYTARNSICTQKVFITLDEKRLDWDMKVIDLFKNEQYDPAYLKLNPKGVVPTLIHEGKPVVESTLICEFLDETFPAPRLLPADAHGRAQSRLWSKAVDEGIFEATREISFSAMFRERMKNMTPEQRAIRFKNVGDPERSGRFLSTYEHGVDSAFVFYGIAAFEKLFKAMDDALADGRPWLTGDGFTLGDVNLMPFVARLEYLDLLDIWIEDRPRVQAWWARAKARPSFASAISGRLAPEDEAAMKTHGGKLRDAIRKKRAEYVGGKGLPAAA